MSSVFFYSIYTGCTREDQCSASCSSCVSLIIGPFLLCIFFHRQIVISKAADIEEVLLRQKSIFGKRSGHDLLRVVIGNGLLAMGDKEKHQEHRHIFEPVLCSTNVKGMGNEVMRVHMLNLLGTLFELCRRAGDGDVTINFSEYIHAFVV
ncbi:cytochrome p450-like protein [Trypanosoma rangeli]|uniref:Cytochrome p450-like protein n=1 Tax=Trypanosoma rangeli TaxID=5698 RepID=A0A422NNH8_TRYRA|nr:cytochrome p450-like protein [Trypanosoma rangeli]RNF07033.1 cytochrome p450-like protein [Trypanosoma rangeli]|eukprot:RNF07033.1 cytochrome p450-like protein [Trypanosoma rangeli]